MTLRSPFQTGVMDNHQKKLEEQFVVEQFLDAHQVFARDPLDFIDKDGNKIDDRLDEVDEI